MILNPFRNKILSLNFLRSKYMCSVSKKIQDMHQKNPSTLYNISPNILSLT